jgi:transcription antitermination factor NusG
MMTNQSVGMRLVEGGLQSHWYAVQTKPRHEKKVSYELAAKDIRCFLPIVSRQSQWSDRRRTIEEPLFAGYVFARFAPKSRARIALLQTKGIVGLVGGSGSGTPIPEGEIYAIQQILERRLPVQAHGFLSVGERVKIRGGALDGLEGILESIKGDQSLIVSIETIQRSISVTISGYDVVPVPNSIRPNPSLTVVAATS